MTTIGCPHQQGAVRSCGGCKVIDDRAGMVACDGEATASVKSDSAGDAGVIGGIELLVMVEDVEVDCKCELTEGEMSKLTDMLAERGQQEWADDDMDHGYDG